MQLAGFNRLKKGGKMRNFKCEFCGKGETCYLQMPDDKYPNYCVAEEAEDADWQEDEEIYTETEEYL